ncbi:MAG: patatin, partial [Rubricoccaceae bacterium]|nr:patatin [Rubricoccaceae bacterium]
IAAGRLDAFAITTTSYSTGQSVTWVQGSDVDTWDRPNRRAVRADVGVDHVLASASLPFFFPAVPIRHATIGDGWYGDGGIRLTAPLSPALHLGAKKILAVSTKYGRTAEEADVPVIDAYPPPAQILGVLMNAIFLDLLDRDAQVLRRINRLLETRELPPGVEVDPAGFRKVKLLVLRPSTDLAKLASQFEPTLPSSFRFLMRGLGVRETRSPDWLSMLLFEPGYLRLLIEIGEADAEARADQVAEFLEND